MADSPIDETTPFGRRAGERLRTEKLVWLTTVGGDGTPQPNPVWFLWDGASGVTVYNAVGARRMEHVRKRPEVSLNFQADAGGSDVVVIRGRAALAPDLPSSDRSPAYQEKYGQMIADGAWGTPEAFDREYPHKLRITLLGVRGF
ncbi:MAG: pyridoxamine 5'-phosphate oxidase family protein [Candidatus Dormibacteraceae bacterium]